MSNILIDIVFTAYFRMNEKWLSSKEAKEYLKISDCELMHKRIAGKIKFKKVKNAYFYCVKEKN